MAMIWIGICVVAIVIELLTPSALVSIWFAAGSIVAWLLALAGMDVAVQVIACIVVSLLFVVLIRPIAVKSLRGNVVATNADRLIGDQGIVVKEILEDAWGEVRINGAIWSAVAVEPTQIEVGSKVRIIAIEGAKLLVRKIEEQ